MKPLRLFFFCPVAALLLSSILIGCRAPVATRPVLWLGHPASADQQGPSDDVETAFPLNVSCQGLTLQRQGVPRQPNWVLQVAYDQGAGTSPSDAVPPIQWSIAHGEDQGIAFHGTDNSADAAVQDICKIVKQQGKL